MNRCLRKLYHLLLLFSFLLYGCDATEHPLKDSIQKKEILIYSGTTMIQPVIELAKIMEQEKECIVKISYGGSGHLARSVEINKIGDIFFPGTRSILYKLQEKGLLSKTIEVGENKIALFVTKGNPHKVKADLHELLRPDLELVIGAIKAGAVGKETQFSLERLGIYNDVISKALYLTMDSKGLVQALRQGDADITLNWQAVEYMKDNNRYIDKISLPPKQAESRVLAMGLLNYSKHPELARYFLELASSSRGKAIFKRYGF